MKNFKTALRLLGSLLAISVSASSLCAKEAVLQDNDRIRFEFQRGRSVSDVKGGSIGEKLASFEPSLRIINSSFNDFPGNKVCIILMGEDTTIKDSWKVMYRREFDADLAAGKTFKWVGEPFQQGFDRMLAKSGYDYDGYIVVIRNAEGKAVKIAGSKPYWAKDPEFAWNLQEGQIYQKTAFPK